MGGVPGEKRGAVTVNAYRSAPEAPPKQRSALFDLLQLFEALSQKLVRLDRELEALRRREP